MSVGMITPTMSDALMNPLSSIGSPAPSMVTGLGLSMVGSPMNMPSPSMTSPVFTPSTAIAAASITNTPTTTPGTPGPSATVTAPGPVKGSKRVRTSTAATPTLGSAAIAAANGTKGVIGANGTATPGARSRKGTGRKDSAKRKSSVAEVVTDNNSNNHYNNGNHGPTAGGGETPSSGTAAGPLSTTVVTGPMTPGPTPTDAAPGPQSLHNGAMNQTPTMISTPMNGNTSLDTMALQNGGPRTPGLVKSNSMNGMMPMGINMGLSMAMGHPGQYYSTMPTQGVTMLGGLGPSKAMNFHNMTMETMGLNGQNGMMSGPPDFASIVGGSDLSMSVLSDMGHDSSSMQGHSMGINVNGSMSGGGDGSGIVVSSMDGMTIPPNATLLTNIGLNNTSV
ncbi:hypothetical protein BGZ82_006467 [Podila clonocystis]|nr:hypothetical protein BGZ82_006467 [Podila clonocystis]